MSAWQRLNAPRNKRDKRVAKIARDIERERIIALLEAERDTEEIIMLIKGQN